MNIRPTLSKLNLKNITIIDIETKNSLFSTKKKYWLNYINQSCRNRTNHDNDKSYLHVAYLYQ